MRARADPYIVLTRQERAFEKRFEVVVGVLSDSREHISDLLRICLSLGPRLR